MDCVVTNCNWVHWMVTHSIWLVLSLTTHIQKVRRLGYGSTKYRMMWWNVKWIWEKRVYIDWSLREETLDESLEEEKYRDPKLNWYRFSKRRRIPKERGTEYHLSHKTRWIDEFVPQVSLVWPTIIIKKYRSIIKLGFVSPKDKINERLLQ